MPFVEMWVEPEIDRQQTAAIAAIILIGRRILAGVPLPSDDEEALDKAIVDLIKEFPDCQDPKPTFPADLKYREWLDQRNAVAKWTK